MFKSQTYNIAYFSVFFLADLELKPFKTTLIFALSWGNNLWTIMSIVMENLKH